jgi:hypothetical protein
MDHIIFSNPNQPYNVVVVTPAYGGIGETRTDLELIEALTAQAIGLNLNGINDSDGYRIVDAATLPSDHDCDTGCLLYDAWRLVDGAVVVDLRAARGLLGDASMDRERSIPAIESALRVKLDEQISAHQV